MFLKNERSLGVKNGSLGKVESVTPSRMAVMLDDGRAVAFDTKDYAAIDHGYAATIHKTQGVTVDRTYMLATPGLDRHAAYVALSRHREGVSLHYGQEDFADQGKLMRTLGRDRAKDMAADYGETKAPDLSAAVARHGRIVRDLRFAQTIEEPLTAEQRTELKASRASLDQIRPHATLDLETAFASEPSLITEAASGRTQAAIKAMQLESEMRVNPELRADVFVQRWQALDRQRRSLLSIQETSKANRVADRMIGMAKSLERDPQVESILRQRKLTLGGMPLPDRNLGQTLADMIGRTRNRGIEIGM